MVILRNAAKLKRYALDLEGTVECYEAQIPQDVEE